MKASILPVLILTLLSCGPATSPQRASQDDPPVLKDSCDSPDATIACSFQNMPVDLSNSLILSSKDEPGDRLIISGIVYKSDGKTVYPGITIYAYQTDTKGYYSKNGTETGVQKWHGHLHGWCRTDSNGRYYLQSIRPARYPDNSMPAHIHAAIKKETGEMYWISDFVFKDDDLVNEKYLSSIRNMVGGTGVVDIVQNARNTWLGERNIVLTQ